jgi:hypothetical protein
MELENMFRKVVVALSGVAVAAVAFFGGSYAMASGSKPDLPGWVPAAALDKVSLTAQERLAINNGIPTDVAEKFGVSSGSFDDARLLANTSAGPLYVIPGSGAACLALAGTVSCNDLKRQKGVLIDLYLRTSKGGYYVGGGLVGPGTTSISIVHGDGRVAARHAVNGVFAVTEADALSEADAFQVQAS